MFQCSCGLRELLIHDLKIRDDEEMCEYFMVPAATSRVDDALICRLWKSCPSGNYCNWHLLKKVRPAISVVPYHSLFAGVHPLLPTSAVAIIYISLHSPHCLLLNDRQSNQHVRFEYFLRI